MVANQCHNLKLRSKLHRNLTTLTQHHLIFFFFLLSLSYLVFGLSLVRWLRHATVSVTLKSHQRNRMTGCFACSTVRVVPGQRPSSHTLPFVPWFLIILLLLLCPIRFFFLMDLTHEGVTLLIRMINWWQLL